MALPGKLWKLKEWLTVPEAARQLSIVFGEEVIEADVLRLAFEGHLKLSVNFVNPTRVLRRKNIPETGVSFDDFLLEKKDKEIHVHNEPHKEMQDNTRIYSTAAIQEFKYILEYKFEHGSKIINSNSVTTIDGIYNLSMDSGITRLFVENMYYKLIGLPEISLSESEYGDGIFVEPDNHRYWDEYKLMDDFDKNRFQTEYKIKLRFLEDYFGKNNIKESQVKIELDNHKSDYEDYLDENVVGEYCGASSLPLDSVLVVRTSALTDLQVRLEKENEDEANSKSTVKEDIGSKDRGTWLKIIYLLAAKLADTNKAGYRKKNGSFNFSQFETELKAVADDLWPQDDGSTASPRHGLSNDNLKIIFDEAKKLF